MHLDNTLGALLVGGLCAAALYGITCAQTFIFLQNHPEERRSFKLFIAGLWGLDTFDMCLTSHVLYWYLVTNYANFSALAVPVWSILLHVSVTSISDFIVRSMFARRVWRLSKGNYIITGVIVAVSLIDLICGIIITVKAFGVQSFLGLSKIANLLYLNFGAGVTSDLVVAITLAWYLWNSRTGFAKMDSLVNVLMLYTINTGLLTALDACFGLICYAVMPTNFVFIAAYLLLSKLYLNSYLYSLNAREYIRERGSGNGMVSIHLSHLPTSQHTSGTGVSHVAASRTSRRFDMLRPSSALDVERGLSKLEFASESQARQSQGEIDKISILVEKSVMSSHD
ncbi:hypothetical protein PUNSTDRAFT_137699 [Punctularia strigosozonata HHB-11173 SS5]|uniref:uncharacterized protein n=1 Tax=Punctularia strigosozonata (strain HHB-11173) TaxID=741275 RepID=UPI0004418523|nr:uncharacterized protein PUNSTDRAFT_137699 [Punctularia strigosozonata HHB-11173 SS5]EIN05594.1 hypothetical protein PUNSTDRAFT_137699 [Punctularia strigosozonata HHB-11173 SS5]